MALQKPSEFRKETESTVYKVCFIILRALLGSENE